ncbi:PglD-related sugar-binding protein [Cyclobacterium marinum]|uniref:Putative hexapeptide transferase family protein n=1 Tax=Cyclobacterium marinum (strain ATCC 25205 / DSM 745 / LMG 13164 / NCIMB 1802) TaxID=880070 RepID=G0J2T1_CYCMS|nr:DapH/DapD/GlmU-related protein [Cyclobacterium marinum]AEL27418.1 putative hexapeptide transferase family protein [Cyclobacterium marinum DSM 745]MBR9776533.1 hexapeptide transferase [Cytophagales bacterium]|tara:strand:+ start:45006 stop:45626 length:621 start_codon:yes stop_codon:yes gene_type:complete
MVIAGAGSHAMEVLDVLISKKMNVGVKFFDNVSSENVFQSSYPVLKSKDELTDAFKMDPRFMLGVGECEVREFMYKLFVSLGGELVGIRTESAIISTYSPSDTSDVFHHSFIGANVELGLGTLINTGSFIHHGATVGRFSTISPGVQVLGNACVGDLSFIGAGAILLPGVKVGNNVKVAAGAVVTVDVPDEATCIGVPAKIKSVIK